MDPAAPEYAAVRAVLLDPSCSGSGTAGTRGDYLLAAARGEAVWRVGPGIYCSPRHRMPFKSRNEGLQCV